MKNNQISYMRRKNLGNYEHEEVMISVAAEDGEDRGKVLNTIKNEVLSALGLDNQVSQEPAAVEEVVEEPAAEEAPEKKPKKKPAKKGKKEKEPKTVAYDRTVQAHKDELADLLNTHYPDWKKTAEGKKLAKEVSLKLNGEPIFDDKGEILGTFSDKFIDLMRASWDEP